MFIRYIYGLWYIYNIKDIQEYAFYCHLVYNIFHFRFLPDSHCYCCASVCTARTEWQQILCNIFKATLYQLKRHPILNFRWHTINKDTREMSQSRCAAFPRHQKEERNEEQTMTKLTLHNKPLTQRITCIMMKQSVQRIGFAVTGFRQDGSWLTWRSQVRIGPFFLFISFLVSFLSLSLGDGSIKLKYCFTSNQINKHIENISPKEYCNRIP